MRQGQLPIVLRGGLFDGNRQLAMVDLDLAEEDRIVFVHDMPFETQLLGETKWVQRRQQYRCNGEHDGMCSVFVFEHSTMVEAPGPWDGTKFVKVDHDDGDHQ